MIHSEVFEPGTGSRYSIIWGVGADGQPFVALPDYGRAATMDPYPQEHRYVMDKLKISEPDALAVFEFLRNWR